VLYHWATALFKCWWGLNPRPPELPLVLFFSLNLHCACDICSHVRNILHNQGIMYVLCMYSSPLTLNLHNYSVYLLVSRFCPRIHFCQSLCFFRTLRLSAVTSVGRSLKHSGTCICCQQDYKLMIIKCNVDKMGERSPNYQLITIYIWL